MIGFRLNVIILFHLFFFSILRPFQVARSYPTMTCALCENNVSEFS
jgi:hypothetical protein